MIFKELIVPLWSNTHTHRRTSISECTLKLQLLKHPMHTFIKGIDYCYKMGKKIKNITPRNGILIQPVANLCDAGEN